MSTTCLLRLPAPGQHDAEWQSVDAAGMPAGPRQRGPLPLAAAAAGSAAVVVLAPATQILLAEPELPPGSGVKLARAVPFALEEQLTEDIDRLYFAVGRRGSGGGTPVAVVSREVMQGWMSALAAAGIDAAALYADVALMPANPGQTVLWLEGERLAVRRPGMLPFAVELSPVTDALIVAGVIADSGEIGAEPAILESAVLYVTREDWLRVQDEFDGLIERFATLKVQLLPEGPLPWLARQLPLTDAVNLLQGEFAQAADYGASLRQWRNVAALALALLAAHVGAEALQIHRANQESAALDGQIAAVFSSAVPAEPMQGNPRLQMQTRLERIRRLGAGPQYFLRTLQTLGAAIAATPKTNIDALSFRDRTLDLKVTAASVDALSKLASAVGGRGLSAEIQSSTPAAAGIEARMQIRVPSAGPGR